MKSLYSLWALVALAVAVAGAPAARAADAPPTARDKQCDLTAKAATECQAACEKAFRHCAGLVAAGKSDHARTAALCLHCSEFCALTAKVAGRRCELTLFACEACAKACDLCGTECAKYSDAPEMKACAEECKTCAALCREGLKQPAQK